MTSGTLHRAAPPLAWLLATATALLLVVTSALLVSQWRAGGASPSEGGPVLERHGVRVPLPQGTTMLGRDERLFYAGDDGRPVVSVRGPAVLVPGACPDVPGSSRGFVGVVRSSGPMAAAHRALVDSWREALGRAVGGTARASPVEAAPGLRTDVDVGVRIDAPCQPERVRASLLTLPVGRQGRRPVTVVLVRDVGAPGEIGDGVAELMLAGVAVR